MPPIVASAICWSVVFALFWLDRELGHRASPALWIAVTWFLLACSRSLARWLNLSGGSVADQMMDGSPVDRAVFTGLLIAGLIVLFSRSNKTAINLRQCV